MSYTVNKENEQWILSEKKKKILFETKVLFDRWHPVI